MNEVYCIIVILFDGPRKTVFSHIQDALNFSDTVLFLPGRIDSVLSTFMFLKCMWLDFVDLSKVWLPRVFG